MRQFRMLLFHRLDVFLSTRERKCERLRIQIVVFPFDHLNRLSRCEGHKPFMVARKLLTQVAVKLKCEFAKSAWTCRMPQDSCARFLMSDDSWLTKFFLSILFADDTYIYLHFQWEKYQFVATVLRSSQTMCVCVYHCLCECVFIGFHLIAGSSHYVAISTVQDWHACRFQLSWVEQNIAARFSARWLTFAICANTFNWARPFFGSSIFGHVRKFPLFPHFAFILFLPKKKNLPVSRHFHFCSKHFGHHTRTQITI